MILKKTNNQFDQYPLLSKTLPIELIRSLDMKDFDKDGYEITCVLERMLYEANNAPLNLSIQKHVAPVKEWYYDDEDSESGLVIDHSMLLTRWGVSGQAKEDLEMVVKDRPILNKLLGIRPKWGLDFSLDWVDHNGCTEVIHIEQDFKTYEEACEAKEKLENLIDNTDWLDGAQQILKKKSEWEHLSSDDHSDWKAQYFGWHRAFDSLKVFSA